MNSPTKASPRLQPVKALKDQIVALDAAMLVAVTSTEVGAVHKLRTTTRRVQAHLTLLDLLHTGNHPLPIPPHRQQTTTVLRRLRRVRRAAGAVRDLDVQSNSIQLDAPLKAAVHKGSPGDTIRQQAKMLRKSLDARRVVEAVKLVRTLQNEEQDLAAELLALEQSIKPVERRVLSASGLVDRVRRHFAHEVKLILHPGRRKQPVDLRQRIEAVHEDDLHTLRKLAKLCRYMLESAASNANAQQTAQRFEALQEAGGQWHDWLLLQQLSEDFHGRKAELSHRYGVHAEAALADYRLRLNELLPILQGEPKI